MKSVSFALLAGATLSSATDNVLYYPPQAGPRSKTSDITVHSGDTFNITWSTGYPAIDLRIEAYAADSNFTVTPFFNPGLEASSFFMYTLQPHDYYINTSTPISAFFRISDSKDDTQFIRSKNFTIAQPGKNVKLDVSGLPSNAKTHTGSITLFSSLGTVAASGTPVGDSPAQATGTDGSTITRDPNGLAAATRSSSGAVSSSSSDANSNSGLSAGAKAGLGVGITIALLMLAAMIGAGVFLCRRKRSREKVAHNMSYFDPTQGQYSTQTTVLGGRDVKAPAEVYAGGQREFYGGKAENVLGMGVEGARYGEVDGREVNEVDSREVRQVRVQELDGSSVR